MFKCVDKFRQQEIIILDFENNDELAGLRQSGRTDGLLCPECRQPVHVKAGMEKAWHFAHKDLGSCPLAVETANVLAARRLLYRWLVSKHVDRQGLTPANRAKVTVEKRMIGALHRPVDCYVETPGGKGFGYWILERSMRNRDALENTVHRGTLHPVFLQPMLKQVEPDGTEFDLSATERGLTVRDKYAPQYGGGEGCLHYLDFESTCLTTLRALFLRHAPQRYHAAHVLINPIEGILTDQTGVFIHPGEHDVLCAYEAKEAKRERKRKQQEKERQERQCADRLARKTQQRRAMESKAVGLQRIDPNDRDSGEYLKEQELPEITRKAMGLLPLQCERCGKATKDWISSTPGKGKCICRQCYGQ